MKYCCFFPPTLASNLVHILQGQSERLVGGSLGRENGVQGLEEGLAAAVPLLPLHGPALVPAHLFTRLEHVVAVPTGDGDKGHGLGVVADLLDVGADLLGDFLETSLMEGGGH